MYKAIRLACDKKNCKRGVSHVEQFVVFNNVQIRLGEGIVQ